ncbi:MAG: hypothetical protein ACRC33_27715 [Gemmataceae bacterium]
MATTATADGRLPPENSDDLGHTRFTKGNRISAAALRTLSNVCLVAGFASILAAIVVWYLANEPDLAHGERFGIFVGLWAPTFFILSDRLERYAAARRVTA